MERHKTPYAYAPFRTTGRAVAVAAPDHAPVVSHHAVALLRAAAIVALALAGVAVAAWHLPDRIAVLRFVATCMFGLHLAGHNIFIGLLRSLRARGKAGAGRLLAAYEAPGRVTSFDIAFIWLAFALFVPLLDLVVPGVSPLGG